MQRICVFAGSNRGTSPLYEQAARDLGKELAVRGLGIVYGGGALGLMGILAESAIEASGEVIGIIPRALKRKEIEAKNLTESALAIPFNLVKGKIVPPKITDFQFAAGKPSMVVPQHGSRSRRIDRKRSW